MRSFIESFLSRFIKYALCIGLMLGVFCMLLSYTLNADSRLGSLLINLAGDFFMAGLTIGVIDRLIKSSERKKYGDIPDVAKKAINNELWTLVTIMSYNIKDALPKTIKEIIDSELADASFEDNDLINKMRAINLAQLKVIDDSKLTLGMFSEMLRFIRQTLGSLDSLIARYNIVLDTEDIANAIALRDELNNLVNRHGLIVLTVPFFGQQTPNRPLDTQQRTAFMSINTSVIELTGKML